MFRDSFYCTLKSSWCFSMTCIQDKTYLLLLDSYNIQTRDIPVKEYTVAFITGYMLVWDVKTQWMPWIIQETVFKQCLLLFCWINQHFICHYSVLVENTFFSNSLCLKKMPSTKNVKLIRCHINFWIIKFRFKKCRIPTFHIQSEYCTSSYCPKTSPLDTEDDFRTIVSYCVMII